MMTPQAAVTTTTTTSSSTRPPRPPTPVQPNTEATAAPLSPASPVNDDGCCCSSSPATPTSPPPAGDLDEGLGRRRERFFVGGRQQQQHHHRPDEDDVQQPPPSPPIRRSFRVSPRQCPGSPSTSLLKRSTTYKKKKVKEEFMMAAAASSGSSSTNDVRSLSAPLPLSVVALLDLADEADAYCDDDNNNNNDGYCCGGEASSSSLLLSPPSVSATTMELLNQSTSSLFSTGCCSTNTAAKRSLVIEKVVQQAQIRLANKAMLQEMRRVLVVKEARTSAELRIKEQEIKNALATSLQALVRGFLCRCRSSRRQHHLLRQQQQQQARQVQGATNGETPSSSAHASTPTTTTSTDEFEMDSFFALGDPRKLRNEQELDSQPLRRSRHKMFVRQTSDVTMSDFGDSSVTSFGWGDGSSHHNINTNSRHMLSPSHHSKSNNNNNNLNLGRNTIPEYDNFHASFASFAEFGGDDDWEDDDDDDDDDNVSYDVMEDLYSRQRQNRHSSNEDDAKRNNRSASSLPVYSNHAVAGSPHRHGATRTSDYSKKQHLQRSSMAAGNLGGIASGPLGAKYRLAPFNNTKKSQPWSQEAGHMSFSSYFLHASPADKHDVPMRRPNRNHSPPRTRNNNNNRYGGSSCAGGSRSSSKFHNSYCKKGCGETVTTATVTTIHTNFTSKPPTAPDVTMVVIPQDERLECDDVFVRRLDSQEHLPHDEEEDEASLGSFARLGLPLSPPRNKNESAPALTMTVEVPTRHKSEEFPSPSYMMTAQRYNVSLSSFPSVRSSDIPVRRPRRKLTPVPLRPSASADATTSGSERNTKSSLDVSVDTYAGGDDDDEVSLGSFPALVKKDQDLLEPLPSPMVSPVSSLSPSRQDPKNLMNQFYTSMPCSLTMGGSAKDKPIRRPRRKLTPDPNELVPCSSLEEPTPAFHDMVAPPSPRIEKQTWNRGRTVSNPTTVRDYNFELEFSSDSEEDDGGNFHVRPSLSSSKHSPTRQRATFWSSSPALVVSGRNMRNRVPSPFLDGPARPPERQRSSNLAELAQ